LAQFGFVPIGYRLLLFGPVPPFVTALVTKTIIYVLKTYTGNLFWKVYSKTYFISFKKTYSKKHIVKNLLRKVLYMFKKVYFRNSVLENSF